ncbi:MAG TPA: ATP-binding protein [Ideonella sp.]|uniref:sensor histidine kinase n=1 Tax=Ideonella sp. TaxID=1929293 RepID=UPI002BF232DD|nr:ATP-binding protein [Ideonella sp.]HSI51450.1 ATP-binding protein [Ideonella sp.]
MSAPAFSSTPAPRGPRRWQPLLIGLLVLLPIVGGALAGYQLSERAGLSQQAAVANERLELYAATLEAELARYAFLPSLIAAEDDVQALLAQPNDALLQDRASRVLARIGARAGANLIVVTSPQQEVLATSNRYQSASGSEGRPSTGLANALKEGTADFFAANDSDGSTDYYFAQPVRRAGLTLGQVLVRVNLAPLEATWIDLGLRSQSERLMVVDENEVVVMSSVPAWKYRTLANTTQLPITPRGAPNPQPAAPAASGPGWSRYAAASLTPLDLQVTREVEPAVRLVRLPGHEDTLPGQFLAQEKPIVPLAARLIALSDPSPVWRQARLAAWGGAAGGAVLGLLLLYVLHRRRALRQIFLARNALQQANDQLERQVDERTAQLRGANEELINQISQRQQAEDAATQASKLALLGQMSAGISHEINQPLTALRALSRNAIQLLDNGRPRDVANNLKLIDEMTERMGRIVNQLKGFARKESLSLEAVPLANAVRNVLLMLDHRLHAEPVVLRMDVADSLMVRADTHRLEQVLLNLAGNALDAMAHSPQRRLRIGAEQHGTRVLVQVEDSGVGMDEPSLQRLFEPFYTTKPAGQGLGLGLVISSKIVHELGGSLRGVRGNGPDGGMRFEFELDAATTFAAPEETHV